jgi:acetylornithine deacetylase/succinyl-diaminopimelate desuccinylase-like protein
VDRELEASVALLDACAAARDALGAMRACALDAEAAVRRRDGAAAERATRACARLAQRAGADARRHRRRAGSRYEHQAVGGSGVHALQEARSLTVAVLERVVAALSRRVVAATGTPRPASSWSTCVARAFRKSARVACEDAADEATVSMPSVSSKDYSHDGEAAVRVQRELRALGDMIQQLEDGLELLFRRLVQCRVFLLNIRSC